MNPTTRTATAFCTIFLLMGIVPAAARVQAGYVDLVDASEFAAPQPYAAATASGPFVWTRDIVRPGATLIKIFPAASLGGPRFLRAVRGPLPDIPLIPTSGPSAETVADYVSAGAVAVGVGREVFTEGFTPESVEKACRRVRKAMTEARAAD